MCPKYKICRDENVWHPLNIPVGRPIGLEPVAAPAAEPIAERTIGRRTLSAITNRPNPWAKVVHILARDYSWGTKAIFEFRPMSGDTGVYDSNLQPCSHPRLELILLLYSTVSRLMDGNSKIASLPHN